MLNPAVGAVALGGAAAKAMADRGTLNRAAHLQRRVARQPLPKRPLPLPSPSLLFAQGANQMERKPLQITIGGPGASR